MDNLINKKKLILELVLILNRELLDDDKISYQVYRMSEDLIIKDIKIIN